MCVFCLNFVKKNVSVNQAIFPLQLHDSTSRVASLNKANKQTNKQNLLQIHASFYDRKGPTFLTQQEMASAVKVAV